MSDQEKPKLFELAESIANLIDDKGKEQQLNFSDVVAALSLVTAVWQGNYRDSLLQAAARKQQAENEGSEGPRIITPNTN